MRHCPTRLIAVVFSLLVVVHLPAIFGTIAGADPGAVTINEVLASNQGALTGIVDEDGDGSDFLELRNHTDTSYDLTGYVLADGDAIWSFPDSASIPARGYLLVWASGKDRVGPVLHTNFELARSGEYLALVAPGNVVVDEITPGYPTQQANVSWGVLPDGTLGFMSVPTPGDVNSTGNAASLSAPHAAIGRGYFTAPVVETLTGDPGSEIRYTLDGSPPTAASTRYDGTLIINPSPTGVVTLRARSFGSGALPSPEASWSYLFPDSLYGGLARDGLRSLPAIVLNTDDGVYPTEDVKRRGSIEMVELGDDGAGFAVTAGIKEFGESSVDFEKSNMRLFFDSDFGVASLDYPVFEGYGQGTIEPATSFDKLELRGGSWDSWQAAAGGQFAPSDYYLTDRFIRDIRLDMGGVHTHGRFVNVWINGDYRGLYQLRERFDHSFYASYAQDGESSTTIEAIKQNEGRYSNNGDQNVNGDGSVFDGLTGDYQVDKTWVDVDALIDFTIVMSLAEYDFEQEYRGVGSMLEASPNDYVFIYNDNDFRLRPVSSVLSGQIGFSPGYFVPALVPFFGDYRGDPEFDQLVRVRAEKHFCGDGAMTISAMQQRLAFWRAEIDLAMRAEHVRWQGWRSIDYFGSHYVADKYASFDANIASIESRIPELMPDLYDAWQQQGLFAGCENRLPTITGVNRVDPLGEPLAVQLAAVDPDGDPLTFTATGLPPGLTLDAGSGQITGTPTVIGTYEVAARVADPSGAEATTTFDWQVLVADPRLVEILISEIMYHPSEEAVPFGFDPDLASFIEIHNPTEAAVDLSEAFFSDGVVFIFPLGTEIPASGYFTVAEDAIAYELTYGRTPDGEYDGGLANSGERIALFDRFGRSIDDVEFGDDAPWPTEADGNGSSLELRSGEQDNDAPDVWEASSWTTGSPGHANRSDGADTNCDGTRGIVDALVIAQFAAGNRTDSRQCPLDDPKKNLFAQAGDINDDGQANIVDALLISQCVVGIVHPYCD